MGSPGRIGKGIVLSEMWTISRPGHTSDSLVLCRRLQPSHATTELWPKSGAKNGRDQTSSRGTITPSGLRSRTPISCSREKTTERPRVTDNRALYQTPNSNESCFSKSSYSPGRTIRRMLHRPIYSPKPLDHRAKQISIGVRLIAVLGTCRLSFHDRGHVNRSECPRIHSHHHCVGLTPICNPSLDG